jgi:hypothetical protein
MQNLPGPSVNTHWLTGQRFRYLVDWWTLTAHVCLLYACAAQVLLTGESSGGMLVHVLLCQVGNESMGSPFILYCMGVPSEVPL